MGNLNHNQWISQPFSGDVNSPMPAMYQDLRNIDYEKEELKKEDSQSGLPYQAADIWESKTVLKYFLAK